MIRHTVSPRWGWEGVVRRAASPREGWEDVVRLAASPRWGWEDVVRRAVSPRWGWEDVVRRAVSPREGWEGVVRLAASPRWTRGPPTGRPMPRPEGPARRWRLMYPGLRRSVATLLRRPVLILRRRGLSNRK